MGLQDIKETKHYGRTHGRTDGRTDGQRENSIPPLKLRFGGGYNYVRPISTNMQSINLIHQHFQEI